MTLAEFFSVSYAWADLHAAFILAAALLLPVVGTALAWLGKGGRTDADGRFIASAVMGLSLAAVLLEVSAILVGRGVMGGSLLDANVMLLLAPVVCLAGSVVGIRLVFPISELGSVKTVTDLGLFLVACGGLLWLMSKFRGWSVFFLGSFTQLLVVGALALFVIWRLYRRAFGLSGRRARAPSAEGAQPGTALAAPGNPLVAGSLAVGVVALAAGALIALWQLTRPAAPAAAAPATASARPPVPANLRLRPADAPRPPPEPGTLPPAAASAYGYVDDEGQQHYVQTLEQVPPKFRARARPVE